MATINIPTGVLKQDKYLVADYSNAVSPFFQNGGIVAGELPKTGGGNDDPYMYATGDTIQIDLPAITEISFAMITQENGTVITFTTSSITNPRGIRISFTAPDTPHIRFLIVYKV